MGGEHYKLSNISGSCDLLRSGTLCCIFFTIIDFFKLNEGFIQQLADLDFKLTWYRTQLAEEKKKKQEEAMNIGTPA